MDFEKELSRKTTWVQDAVAEYFPDSAGEGYAARLAEAMRYSLAAGGKRIRPLLLYESCLIHRADPEKAKPFMAAIEMIHTHSLIHDDLPALDNDELRRGKPTSHMMFGEAGAILAGDALLNLAYETVLNAFPDCYEEDRSPAPAGCMVVREVAADHMARRWRALKILAEKTGIHGMLGGQSVDVENDKRGNLNPDRPTLEYIYENKTAALLEAPLMIGAVLGGADPDEIRRMEETGSRLGAAFQIRDDILDLTATEETLGKPVKSDESNEKRTFVSLLGGVEKAETLVQQLTDEAIALLENVSGDTAFLKQLIRYMALRNS
ncbi:MAG: polyprenyl synthetase family protein [Eubacterium sp.]|nr:polyprenyl synthetase family protein [Eubacterium sp.]